MQTKSISLGNEKYFKIITGGFVSKNDPSFWGNEIPWVVPIDLPKDQEIPLISTSRKYLSSKGLERQKSRILSPNSLLVVRSGHKNQIGRVAMNVVPCSISQYFFGVLNFD